MRPAALIFVLAIALSACRHVPTTVSAPEEHPTEAEIRAHIPGTWISEDDPRWHRWRTITFGSDGTFVVGLADGIDEVFGTWRVHNWTLVITTARTNHITFLGSGETMAIPPGDVMIFPVVYVDEHRLVYRPGITVAGVKTFRR
jgi:hypothetical protein